MFTPHRNCSFYTQDHQAIPISESQPVIMLPLNILAPGIDALPRILLPLAGPKEFDLDAQEQLPVALQFLLRTKQREPDTMLQSMHVETFTPALYDAAGARLPAHTWGL